MIDCSYCTEGTSFFSSKAGQIVAVSDEALPLYFAVDGDVDTFNDLQAIVTSVGLQAQGGFQFMHAMREFIYVYVFTERMGEFVINGLAFTSTCNFGPNGPQGAQTDNKYSSSCVYGSTGLERIITWYECNRITTRAAPITVMLGTQVSYDVFLVSMKADIANAETGIVQFTMRFNFVPNISAEDDFCFPINYDCLTVPCGSQGVMLRN